MDKQRILGHMRKYLTKTSNSIISWATLEIWLIALLGGFILYGVKAMSEPNGEFIAIIIVAILLIMWVLAKIATKKEQLHYENMKKAFKEALKEDRDEQGDEHKDGKP